MWITLQELINKNRDKLLGFCAGFMAATVFVGGCVAGMLWN